MDTLPWAYSVIFCKTAMASISSRELRLAIEFDGQVKYTSPEVMEAQIVRENNLRAVGWSFVRFGWEDFEDEEKMLLRVSDAAHACRRAS